MDADRENLAPTSTRPPRLTDRETKSARLVHSLSELETTVHDRLSTYAPNTQRALKADWTVWHTWCVEPGNHIDGQARKAFPITPAVLVEFMLAHSPGEIRAGNGTRSVDERLTHARVKSPRTLARYLSSLRALHRLAGYKDDPTADADVEAARRLVMRGRTRAKPKKPLRLSDVESVLRREPSTLRDVRDMAMLAVAYSAMLRRSELVALEHRDIKFDSDGSGSATVRFSKTDQSSEGHIRYLAPFAVTALRNWFEVSALEMGPVFRGVLPIGSVGSTALTSHEVGRIFKRMVKRGWIKDIRESDVGGHSTRIGAAHDLIHAGFDVAAIANAGGWKSLLMPNYYTRELQAKQSAMAHLVRRRNNSFVGGNDKPNSRKVRKLQWSDHCPHSNRDGNSATRLFSLSSLYEPSNPKSYS